jgi:hypothetical protein
VTDDEQSSNQALQNTREQPAGTSSGETGATPKLEVTRMRNKLPPGPPHHVIKGGKGVAPSHK